MTADIIWLAGHAIPMKRLSKGEVSPLLIRAGLPSISFRELVPAENIRPFSEINDGDPPDDA